MIAKIFKKYAEIVTENPGKVFAASIIATIILVAGAQQIETEEQDVNDFLPESYESITALNKIEAEFSSAEATTYTILIETDPEYSNSTEIRDIRNPKALRYIKMVSEEAENFDKVTNVESPTDLFREIPPTKRKVQQNLDQLGQQRWEQTITTEYNAARITIEAAGISQSEGVKLAENLQYHIDSLPKQPGLELTYTGSIFIDQAFQEQSNNTSQTTSLVAFAMVMVVVILLFRSIFYGLTSLQTLIFGVAAGVGLFGWLGLNLSPSTSGAISVGIGIAVDFGIQPVSRYREERKQEGLSMKQSLFKTLEGTVRPMTLGLIAAIMGFSTLAIGDVTFLSDLGIILSLTTLMAYLSALTVIPSTLILHDKYLKQKINKLKNTIL